MAIERRRYTAALRSFGLHSRFFLLLLSTTIATVVPAVMQAQQPGGTAGSNQITSTDKNAIRPVRIHIPQEALGPSRGGNAPAQIVERLLRYVNAERTDCVFVGRRNLIRAGSAAGLLGLHDSGYNCRDRCRQKQNEKSRAQPEAA